MSELININKSELLGDVNDTTRVTKMTEEEINI